MTGSPNGGNLVYLAYLDEAGISNPVHEPFLVVAAVIINGDQQWKAIESDVAAVIARHIPEPEREDCILHSMDLFSGGKRFPREKWPRLKRWEILHDLVELIPSHKLPVSYGLVRRDPNPFAAFGPMRPEVQHLAMHSLAFSQCATSIDYWMHRYARPEEVAMLIAEDAPRVKPGLKHALKMLRSPALLQRNGVADIAGWPLTKIVDTLHFAGKSETPILQLADAAALKSGGARKATPERRPQVGNPGVTNDGSDGLQLAEGRVRTSVRPVSVRPVGKRLRLLPFFP